jgi:uncharacterized RDD family membrane protein YckC
LIAPKSSLASAPRRIAAAAVDLAPILLCVIFAVAAVDQVQLGAGAMLAAALLVFVAYHATFHYRWSGETPGCRLLSIRVVGGGKAIDLSPAQCVARPCIQIVWLLAFLPVSIRYGGVWVAALPAFVDLALMSSLPTRQTVADLLCRTLVIKTPPRQAHRVPAAGALSATE